MKIFLLSILTTLVIFNANAQDIQSTPKPIKVAPKERVSIETDGWKHSGFLVVNINQMAQSEWISGGENFQIGINAIINKALHHKKGKFTFDTYLDMEIGIVEAASYSEFRKTNDRFDLTFEIQHTIKNNRNLKYALVSNIRTQLFEGYSYKLADKPKISGFFSPGKILLGAGLDYTKKDESMFFSLFSSPFAIRMVTKLDNDFYTQKKFGVDSFKKVYNQLGANVSIHFFKKFSPTTSFVNRTDLYSNYLRTPENIDILVNNVFLVNMSKKFVFSLLLDIAYDHYTKMKTQIYQTIGIGLTLKL